MIKVIKISNFEIKIDREGVKRFLHYKKNKTYLPSGFEDMLDDIIDNIIVRSKPSALYFKDSVIDKGLDFFRLENLSMDIKSRVFYSKFKGSKYIYIMAMTIGKEVVDYIDNCSEMSQQIVADAVASDGVEYCAEYINNIIDREAKRNGYRTTMRFSPGYGGLGLQIQGPILELLNAKDIGLSLTESNIILPRKSITAFIGLVPSTI